MASRFHAVVVVLVLVGCSEPPPLYPPSAPPEIVAACAVAERRCSECHDRDRIINAHKNREEWESTIDRMRQMAGSTIRPDEADVILRCVLYRNDMSEREPRRTDSALLASCASAQETLHKPLHNPAALRVLTGP